MQRGHHVCKDTLLKSSEWWKHLRPFKKRRVTKKERRAVAEQRDVIDFTSTNRARRFYRTLIEP